MLNLFSKVASPVVALTDLAGITDSAPAGRSKFAKNFPEQDYLNQRARYSRYWDYFTGPGWEVKSKSGGERFPLRINPIRTFALKHAYTLMGEVPDNASALVDTRIEPDYKDEADKELARKIERAIDYVYWENNMRALMMENALLSQFLCGCVFMVNWRIPNPINRTGIRIERVLPDYFIGVPDGSDMYNLAEAWIAQPITAEEAANKYNVPHVLNTVNGEVLLITYWNRHEYEVSIDGRVASQRVGDTWIPMAGANTIGVVPCVYIPHERSGKFEGWSLVDVLERVAQEYNARMADQGDAVKRSSQGKTAWYSNVAQGIKRVQIEQGTFALNLGNSGPGEDAPKMGEVGGSELPQSSSNFTDDLYLQLRRDGFVPAVADGEDEGSQRSSLTLAVRFYPLTSHILSERDYWSPGLNLLSEIILLMANNKSPIFTGTDIKPPKDLVGVNESFLARKKYQKWHPMLPRDRQELVDEWVQRSGSDLGSPDLALGALGDVDDIEGEKKLILDWKQARAKIDAEAAPKPFGGSSGNTAPAPKKTAKD